MSLDIFEHIIVKKMTKIEFEKIVQANESDLQQIRSKYFPLIEEGVITGYNLYPGLFDCSKGKFFLNYLHSDLRKKDRHYKELTKLLKREGFLEEMILINNELVDRESTMGREANYLTKLDWKDPQNMRYFTFRGRELSEGEAKTLRRMIIGESFQYDLMLRVKDELELREIIDIFKRYTSKYILDGTGRKALRKGHHIENPNAIYNSWDIPLLVCLSREDKRPNNLRDFLVVNQFSIEERLGRASIILSTLVRKNSKTLVKILKAKEKNFKVDKKYALRVFLDNYVGE